MVLFTYADMAAPNFSTALMNNASSLLGYPPFDCTTTHIESPLLPIVTSLAVTWLVWRLWRFTLAPTFKTNQPPELPYWFPFIGHTASFFKDPQAILTYGRKYFGNTRDVFALSLGGQKFYVVTKPSDIVAVYKNFKDLTFDGYVRDMYSKFGMSADGMAKLFSEDVSGAHTTGGALRKRGVLGPDLPHQQLKPSSNHYEDVSNIFKAAIEAQLDPRNIPSKSLIGSENGEQTVSLRSWTTEVLGRATIEAFFGHSLEQIHPDTLDDLRTFDSHSWMLLYKYPRHFAKVMYGSMDRLLHAFETYFEQPAEKRADAGHWIGRLAQLQLAEGMSTRDMATSALLIFWVVNGNPPKVTFWMLAYIFHDADLAARIRTELSRAPRPDGGLDITWLTDTQNTPLLHAAFHETLRLTAANSSARDVEAHCVVGGAELKPGAKVLVPFRQLHFAEEIYPAPYAFRPERFLTDARLAGSDVYRPFGGGITYCPGRYLTKREVLGFAAVALMDYDVRIVGDGKMPQLDLAKPNPGTVDPVGEADVLLAIRRKAASLP